MQQKCHRERERELYARAWTRWWACQRACWMILCRLSPAASSPRLTRARMLSCSFFTCRMLTSDCSSATDISFRRASRACTRPAPTHVNPARAPTSEARSVYVRGRPLYVWLCAAHLLVDDGAFAGERAQGAGQLHAQVAQHHLPQRNSRSGGDGTDEHEDETSLLYTKP
jgi:hypothetical protein